MNGFESLLEETREMRRHAHKRSLSMCHSKRAFLSKSEANEEASRIFCIRKVSLRVYECPICNKYHLTSKRKNHGNER